MADTFFKTTGSLSSALANTHMFVGNASGIATDVAMSGQASIANTGAVTVNAVTGSTAGVAIGAGIVGESLTARGTATTTTAGITSVVTLTLTVGVWLVSATHYGDNTASQTGYDAYLYIKNATTSTTGTDLLKARYSAGNATSLTFASRVVVIATGDANKTVEVRAQSVTNNLDSVGYIAATRVA